MTKNINEDWEKNNYYNIRAVRYGTTNLQTIDAIEKQIQKVLAQQKEEIEDLINKEYEKAENMQGEYEDIKKAIFAMEVLNKVKELIEKL